MAGCWAVLYTVLNGIIYLWNNGKMEDQGSSIAMLLAQDGSYICWCTLCTVYNVQNVLGKFSFKTFLDANENAETY